MRRKRCWQIAGGGEGARGRTHPRSAALSRPSLGGRSGSANHMGEKSLDIVTLIGSLSGTVTDCESGRGGPIWRMAFGRLHGFLSGESGTAREGFLTLLGGGGQFGGRPLPPLFRRAAGADGAEHKAGGSMGRGNEELVLQAGRGGRAPLKRKPVKRDWTKAKEAKFIEQLAVTCNVTLAAELAKVGNSTVYSRRRKMPRSEAHGARHWRRPMRGWRSRRWSGR